MHKYEVKVLIEEAAGLLFVAILIALADQDVPDAADDMGSCGAARIEQRQQFEGELPAAEWEHFDYDNIRLYALMELEKEFPSLFFDLRRSIDILKLRVGRNGRELGDMHIGWEGEAIHGLASVDEPDVCAIETFDDLAAANHVAHTQHVLAIEHNGWFHCCGSIYSCSAQRRCCSTLASKSGFSCSNER
ncbi:hypothetical protein F183_A44260 [Bryobacterales bacterium F-183]|nr:hypothetical protein F183_A44260 [Bryobacterales bacterium F-183]